MSNSNIPDSDSGSTPVITGDNNKSASKFPKISRDITDQELKTSSGARKLLLMDLDRLYRENDELNHYKDDFYRIDKDYAVMQVQIDDVKSRRFLSDAAKMAGSIIIGLIPSMGGKLSGWVIFTITVVAIAFIVAAFVSQYHHKKN